MNSFLMLSFSCILQ